MRVTARRGRRPGSELANSWDGAAPQLGCSSQLTCIDADYNCQVTTDGTCDTLAGFGLCETSSYSDKAVTNGRCKTYSRALELLFNERDDLSACEVSVTFQVNNGGNITLDGCHRAGPVACAASSVGGEFNLTVTGGPRDVSAVVSNFTFW